ncbi:MAG: hypothetical protein LQ350_000727 [Teloschistes chrysophthalmus]|nr:MAG: hypothetical protein LQ350_000727 [Niorma chrysophthalma]
MSWPVTIYAAGFNSHGQLNPLTKPHSLYTFKPIAGLEEYKPLSSPIVRFAEWSSTILAVSTDPSHPAGNMIHLGFSGASNKPVHFEDVLPEPHFYGNESGVQGYLSRRQGNFYPLEKDGGFQKPGLGSSTSPTILPNHCTMFIAIAHNDKVCVATSSRPYNRSDPDSRYMEDVHIFPNLSDYLSGVTLPEKTYPIEKHVVSLAASLCSFTLLTKTGRVLTLGEARYPRLLGRTPCAETPASKPGDVSALDGIRIRKVAAGLNMIAALSHDKDVYVWGHALPQPLQEDRTGFSKLLNAANADGEAEDVHLVDLPDGADVEDVVVGSRHIAVLTTNGDVWGMGTNGSGQLGLGKEVKGTDGNWVKCFDAKEHGGSVVEMAAAPMATFIVVKADSEEEVGKKRRRQ